MGKKQLLALLTYLGIIVLYIFIVNSYINNKDYTLREQAYSTFEDFFKYQKKYIDTYRSNGRIMYNLIPNPPLEKPGFTFIEEEKNEWRKKMSDIYKFYKIDDVFTGWKLFVAEPIYGDIGAMVTFEVFPTHVAYRRQSYSYYDSWYPSIENCIKESYEFYTTDPKSRFIDDYNKGNSKLVDDFISKVSNKYYSFYGEDIWQPVVDKDEIGAYGYMYNNFYRVFIGCSDYKTYKIKKREEVVTRDKAVGIIIGFLVISALYASLAINWTLQKERKKELLAGPLFNNLKSKCNPGNFMDPYDREKIDTSNRIYKDLLRTQYTDIKSLKIIRKRMEEELGVKFIDSEYIEALKSKCSPAQFMDPYDAEKVSLANKLYAKLMNNLENIEALEELEREIESQLS